MALLSKLFKGDSALEACLVTDAGHVVKGAKGSHVEKIQRALVRLDGALIALSEVTGNTYGETTANAVLAYKRKRNIINFTYQASADNIVGKMTIAALDEELLKSENRPPLRGCKTDIGGAGGGGQTFRSGRLSPSGDDVPPFLLPPTRLNVAIHIAEHPKDNFANDDHLSRMISRAAELLRPIGLSLSTRFLSIFPYAFSVGEKDDIDVRSIRKAAEKASPGAPALLRVIMCHLRTESSTAISQGRATGIEDFPNFVLINRDRNHPDNGTLLHEMIHCSNDRFMNDIHDQDQDSIYSRGADRFVLRQEHAESLQKSFFATPGP